MEAIERLRRDHAILRSKLDVLESALKMGPEAWFVLREVSHTLAQQLRDHIRREEALVAVCRSALREQALTHITVEHHDEPQRLRTLSRLFIKESGQSLRHIEPVLTEIIAGLRHHMEEEEQELFPVLEQVLAEQQAAVDPSSALGQLDEVMTINWVLQQYPKTRGVFEQLFINIPYEGSDCLDEVAWRHGMGVQDLISKLEQTIVSCACRGRGTSKNTEPLTAPQEIGAKV